MLILYMHTPPNSHPLPTAHLDTRLYISHCSLLPQHEVEDGRPPSSPAAGVPLIGPACRLRPMLIEAKEPSWQVSFGTAVWCIDEAKAEELPASEVNLRPGPPNS